MNPALSSKLHQIMEFARERRSAVTAAVAFLVVIAVYLCTMMPGPAFMDTGEFQTVTYVLGIAHPTGYPLYTIIGKLFGTLLPIGGWAWRMNLMSSLSAATAAALLAVFALRYRISPVVAVGAALCFAWMLNTWMSADKADPYSMTVLIAATLWVMASKWSETADRRWLWGLALLAGLGLGAAGVLAMELPAIVLFVLLMRPKEFLWLPTLIVAGLLGVFGIVAIYTYLPLRSAMHPPLNYGNTYTWAGFKFVALGGQVGGIMNYISWEGLRIFKRHFPEAVGWYRDWLGITGLKISSALALCGLIALALRHWRLALCAVIGFLIPIYPTLTMPINDTTHYLLICNWLFFFLVAYGVEELLAIGIKLLLRIPMPGISPALITRTLTALVYVVVIAAPLYLARVNWAAADMHAYNDAEILSHGALSRVKPNAVVFCWWGPSNALWYARFVEGLRPDVDVYDDSTTLDKGWGGVTPAIALFYPQRPVYSLPIGDQVDTIEKKFNLKLVADLHAFGQSLFEVTGPAGAPSAKASPATEPPAKAP
jgi:hypothetical protein